MRKESFFDRQDRLRNVSKWLLFLTILGSLGVGSLGGIATALVHQQLAYRDGTTVSVSELLPVIALGAMITLATTASVVFVRLLVLHFSRTSVRRFFKARDLSEENARESLEAANVQLLNIVEEMSIASTTPMPHVFLLEDDASINSFALVHSRERGTLGVTAGARDSLSRDELQAMIAHELGHISNGDAAVNIRLLALIQGFRFIYDTSVSVIGAPFRIFDSFKTAFFFTFYLSMIFGAFFVLGLFGVGIARLMQAAIARQREYLADASAVQFTRHTSGLIGALQKADQLPPARTRRPVKAAAFMMFVSPYRARSWLLRTHPTIDQRIEAAKAMTPGRTSTDSAVQVAERTHQYA